MRQLESKTLQLFRRQSIVVVNYVVGSRSNGAYSGFGRDEEKVVLIGIGYHVIKNRSSIWIFSVAEEAGTNPLRDDDVRQLRSADILQQAQNFLDFYFVNLVELAFSNTISIHEDTWRVFTVCFMIAFESISNVLGELVAYFFALFVWNHWAIVFGAVWINRRHHCP